MNADGVNMNGKKEREQKKVTGYRVPTGVRMESAVFRRLFFLIPGLRQHEAERTGFCMRGRGHFLHCFIGCIESDGVERLWYGHSVYCYQGCSILG